MPSPNILDWCSESISSINKSFHQLLYNYKKMDFETSPYISEIQSLKGSTPSEKYKDLNLIVKSIVENTKAKGKFVSANEFREIKSPALISLIQISAAEILKNKEIIIQGLTSDDASINKKALNANWFFHASNNYVNADNFARNIMPFVSIKTRLGIIRKLSYSLEGFEKKSEDFFNVFVKLYGFQVCLPILITCSESFIYDKIFEYKIQFPIKILNLLFKKNPKLVIKYLQLGNKNNNENEKDRKIFQIEIHEYDLFITKLIKNHPKDFIKLYKITPEKTFKLKKKLSTIFLQNLKDELMKEPNIFLKLLSSQIVSKNLKETEFDTIMEKLFPNDINDFNLNNILEYCEYFPQENIVQLLKDKYKLLYNTNLLSNTTCLNSRKFIKMLENEEREDLIKDFLKKHESNDDLLYLYTSYLPPNEIMPLLKTKIKHASNIEERAKLIVKMIDSCNLYASKDNLLKVLDYYNNNHKNEQNFVLLRLFESLNECFDLKSLDNSHWTILKEIIFHAYVKKELFISNISLVESILEAELFHVLTYEKENMVLSDKIFDILLECKVEHSFSTLNILREIGLEKEYLEKMLEAIPQKYPEYHTIWKTRNDRLALTLRFVKSIHNYNEINRIKSRRKSRQNLSENKINNEKKIKIEMYPWIIKLAEEFFQLQEKSERKRILLNLIKQNAPNIYEENMDKYAMIRNIESGDALRVLKKDPNRILENWTDYLSEARKKVYFGSKPAKRFIAATKWYNEIPVKFIEKCLLEIRQMGSINVLAILLEVDVFEKIIIPYIPQNERLNLNEKNAKENYEMTQSIIKAMKDVNASVSFNVISSFCKGDYALLAENLMVKIVQCAPEHKVIAFAIDLSDGSTSLKKLSFRIFQKVATMPQLRKFLEDRFQKEINPSVRQVIIKIIFNLFTKSPCISNWKLLKTCIESLSIHDEQILETFSDIQRIDSNFVAAYIDTYLNKIESGFKFNTKVKCISLFIESFDARIMHFVPEEVSEAILKKYFYDADFSEISRVVQNFAIRLYLLQSGEEFQSRLNIIIEILKKIVEDFNLPHPKKPRFYAANYAFSQFLDDVVLEISNSKSDKKLKIVDSLLEIFNSTLYNWQEPLSYLRLNLFKEYLLATSPEDFGIRCGKRIFSMVGDFSNSECIIDDIVKCLEDFINTKIYKKLKKPNLKISIIIGLIKDDNYYGNLVGIRLLDSNEVHTYDERYDEIIKALKRKQPCIIRYTLSQHLNTISSYSDVI